MKTGKDIVEEEEVIGEKKKEEVRREGYKMG